MTHSVSTRPDDNLILDLEHDEWDAVVTMLTRMKHVEEDAMEKNLEQFDPQTIEHVAMKVRGRTTSHITVTPDEFVIISDAVYDTFGRREPTITPKMERAKDTIHTIDNELGGVELQRQIEEVLSVLNTTNHPTPTPDI